MRFIVSIPGNSTLYQPLFNLTTYQKWAYYFGINIFTNLPSEIKKNSHNVKQLSLALSDFLHSKSFLLWTSILIVLQFRIWFYLMNIIIHYSTNLILYILHSFVINKLQFYEY